jgi:hypothetical protein
VTLLLVHTAHPQAVSHAGSGFGRLLSPRHYWRVADTAAAGIPWAADNDCYQGLDRDAYVRMLWGIRELPGCLFVVCPDVVADADATRQLWREWAATTAWVTRQPLAYVLQDGDTTATVPWDECDCVFVGGSTAWKVGVDAERIVRHAKQLGKWAHMGRVNSRRRYDYARSIGCDSVDGTSFSRFRDRWLPPALRWHREPLQERLAL